MLLGTVIQFIVCDTFESEIGPKLFNLIYFNNNRNLFFSLNIRLVSRRFGMLGNFVTWNELCADG